MNVDKIILLSHEQLKNNRTIKIKLKIYHKLTPILNKLKSDYSKISNSEQIAYKKRIQYAENILEKYKLRDTWCKYSTNINNLFYKKYSEIVIANKLSDINNIYLDLLKARKIIPFYFLTTNYNKCEQILENKIANIAKIKNNIPIRMNINLFNNTNRWCNECSEILSQNINKIIFFSQYIKLLNTDIDNIKCNIIPKYPQQKFIDYHENPNEIVRKKNIIYNFVKNIEYAENEIKKHEINKCENIELKIVYCLKKIAKKLSIKYLILIKNNPQLPLQKQKIINFAVELCEIFKIPVIKRDNIDFIMHNFIMYVNTNICNIILHYKYYNVIERRNKIMKIYDLIESSTNYNDINCPNGAIYLVGKILGYIVSL